MNRIVLALYLLTLSWVPLCSAQSFDENPAIWPDNLSIRGSIYLSSAAEPADRVTDVFMRAVGSNKESNSLLLLDFSGDARLNDVETRFEDLTLNLVSVNENTTAQSLNKLISEQSAVWLRSSKSLSAKQSKLLDSLATELRRIVNQPQGLLVFSGAIANRAGKLTQTSELGMSLTREELNLVPDTLIKTSYNDAIQRNALLSGLAANPLNVGVGIPVNGAIVLSGRKIRVLGDGAATFLLMANEHQPLRVQSVEAISQENRNPYKTIVDLTAWRRDAIERRLPPFPSETPPTPNVESGTLFIVGGGGLPDGLMRDFVDKAGGKNAKILYVPCTEAEEVSQNPPILRVFQELGAEANVFHTKDRTKAMSDEEFLKPLRDATGIWFGGGRQWNFVDSYYGTTAHKLMKEVLARGGVIGGSSAGASIQADYLARANPVANFDIMAPGYERGLGFIKGVAIDQHFTQRGRQKDMTELANRYPQLLGIGIDERTALIVNKSVGQVTGRGRVFFYDRNQPVIPGQDDYLALQAGESYDLASRSVVAKESTEAEIEPASDTDRIPESSRILIQKAVSRLLELQEDDGAWPYEGVYRVRGQIPVGYRIGGTAIACDALLASRTFEQKGLQEAIESGVRIILQDLESPLMQPSTVNTYDVRVWGHIYALQFFSNLQSADGFESEKQLTKPWLQKLVAYLETEALESGGWNYATRNRHACFVTSPAVQALMAAKELGMNVSAEILDKAKEALKSSRSENGSYQYSGKAGERGRTDLLPGAIARATVSETTLIRLGGGDVDHLRSAIDAFHEHWNELEKRRGKTGTHVAPYGVAPYYFYYGHRYLAQGISSLPQDEQTAAYEKFETVLKRTMDKDFTWNDRVFPRSKAFGTSMAVLALLRGK